MTSASKQALLTWFDVHHREMPWRLTKDPYAIWVSEMMLQQTQVVTATPYWLRWIERFPSVASLADAPLDDVLMHWQGLGYYARARNMHKAAAVVLTEHNGVFPTSYDDLLALPGVGPYTAAAVSSISTNAHKAVVDANVIRVLCRHEGIEENPKLPAVQVRLQTIADANLDQARPGDFNQAMMELGATLCTPKGPLCDRCPIGDDCIAKQTGMPERYPLPIDKPKAIRRTDVLIIALCDGKTYTHQLPQDGLWGGLYSFPRVSVMDGEHAIDAVTRLATDVFGSDIQQAVELGRLRHAVTIYNVELIAYIVNVNEFAADPQNWRSLSEIDTFPMPNPQAKLWAKHKQELLSGRLPVSQPAFDL
ncbi:MAG: A/G-specific adenine glycosylase [Armatimonadaceae bacterium]